MSWAALENGNPELAAFGQKRLTNGVAFLATVRKDGSPRLHPVTPIVGDGRLFLFMEPTSPKRFDLIRGGRYIIHAAVEDNSGGGGEFLVGGTGTLTADPADWEAAVQRSAYQPHDRYILFELTVDMATSKRYQDEGDPLWQRWSAQE